MDSFNRFYTRFFAPFALLMPLVLLVLRWNWGALFMKAGADKIAAPDRFVKFFDGLGIPFPEANVWLVSHVEYYLGFLLLIGLGARLAAFPLFITMVVAMFTAHWDGVASSFPSFNPMEWNFAILAGESPFIYMVVTILVMALGPGMFSIDGILKGIFDRK